MVKIVPTAEEILELLESRYPDHTPLVEMSQFRHGEDAGIQKIINEIRTEVNNGSKDNTKS